MRYMPEEKESTFFVDIFKIVLGVFIGGLLAALAYTKIMSWAAEHAAREAVATMQKELDAQAAKLRQETENQRLQREAVERSRIAETRAQAAFREQRQREQQEHEARMRAEWQRIYQPSAACRLDPTTMPCVNAHAAAHKRFLELHHEFPPRF